MWEKLWKPHLTRCLHQWNWHYIASVNSIRNLTRLDPTPGRYGNSCATNLHQCAVASPAGSHGSLISSWAWDQALRMDSTYISTILYNESQTDCNNPFTMHSMHVQSFSSFCTTDLYRLLQIHWDFSFVESTARSHLSLMIRASQKSPSRTRRLTCRKAQVLSVICMHDLSMSVDGYMSTRTGKDTQGKGYLEFEDFVQVPRCANHSLGTELKFLAAFLSNCVCLDLQQKIMYTVPRFAELYCWCSRMCQAVLEIHQTINVTCTVVLACPGFLMHSKVIAFVRHRWEYIGSSGLAKASSAGERNNLQLQPCWKKNIFAIPCPMTDGYEGPMWTSLWFNFPSRWRQSLAESGTKAPHWYIDVWHTYLNV